MEFKIGKPVIVPDRPSETYVLTINTIYNDGELNEKKIEIDSHNPDFMKILLDIVNFIKYAQVINPYNYAAKAEFYQKLIIFNDEHDYVCENLVRYDLWERIQNFNITYFDSCGIEYDVEIVE